LARFVAAALPGPDGEPPGRGVLSPAGVRLAVTAAPATEGRWGLGYGLGLLPSGDRLAYHEGANHGWRAGLALLPDRRAGIAVLANGDGGTAPINAVVQQWLALATPSLKHTRLRAAALGILAVAAVTALGLAARHRPRQPSPPHKGRWRGLSSSRPSSADAPNTRLERHHLGASQQAIEQAQRLTAAPPPPPTTQAAGPP
jgi:hypothetical protein